MRYRQLLTFISLVLCFSLISACSVQMGANETATDAEARDMVFAGYNISFAVRGDGSLYAWGRNNSRPHADGSRIDQYIPIKIMDGVISVVSMSSTTAVIKEDGSLWTWGYRRDWDFGATRVYPRVIWYEPTKIMDDVAMVSAGHMHTMVLKTDGSLWAWGDNRHGQIGDGTTMTRHDPVKIMEDVIYVSAGGMTTMAIKADGSLWAWGDGPLGDGARRIGRGPRNPVKVMEDVVSVSVGWSHSAAIKTDGSLWVWGGNSDGQIGDGTRVGRAVPTRVMEDVVAVSAGGMIRPGPGRAFTMAIRTDGSLWIWGGDGISEVESKLTPVQIKEDVVAASVGSNHFIVATSDGALWTWGLNEHGQLGDGTTTDRDYPVRIMDGVNLP